MRFLRLLLAEAGSDRVRIVVTTIVAGIAMGSVMAVINTVTDYQKQVAAQITLLGVFIFSCSLFLLSKSYALSTTSRVVEALLDRTRVRFADKIRRARLTDFEGLADSLRVSLPRDMQTLSEAGTIIVHGASSAVMLLCSALYVASLSLSAFLITALLFGSAVYFYKRSQVLSGDILRRAAQADVEFYGAFGHLLGGFKEVKLSTARGQDLHENYLVRRSAASHRYRVDSARRFNAGANVTNIFFYILIGTLVFGLPDNLETSQIAAKVINVIIFVGSAIEIVLRALPMLAKANLAVESLDRLERRLDEADERADLAAAARGPALRDRIACRMLSYSYFDPDGKEMFRIGPVDFEVRAGEILFIVGGNGSGKSTLIRLLARLYEPRTGAMFWDGAPVDQDNLAEYRNLFSAIFSDFHLFDRLYGLDGVDGEEVAALLERMELSHKTGYAQGRFSRLDLSTGQRKRLALVTTLLEDKAVWIFDEWAADQDPTFRRVFYEELLPEWRARGKTLVVVTHDDRYFHVADRVLVMEEGRMAAAGASA
ncbi:MAG: cyclic peptide export ABC transporter [Geminicoccaceae bacterium]